VELDVDEDVELDVDDEVEDDVELEVDDDVDDDVELDVELDVDELDEELVGDTPVGCQSGAVSDAALLVRFVCPVPVEDMV
jgi:hypothetical protein